MKTYWITAEWATPFDAGWFFIALITWLSCQIFASMAWSDPKLPKIFIQTMLRIFDSIYRKFC